MRVAVVGCCHGNLALVYRTIQESGPPPDLVLITGDFQAVRDQADLESMACPEKYRRMGDFRSFQQGVPYLTVFIGGNHEASRHMVDHRGGGWLAPNLYYLGDAGVVTFLGYTIAGISGIYHASDFHKPHFERPPFSKDTIRSVYHQRQADVQKLWLMGPRTVDIFMSHDWPRGVERAGPLRKLLAKKPWFKEDVAARRLGSPATIALLHHLQPGHWLSSHMHVHYEARVEHGPAHCTDFLALDKAEGRGGRRFLQFLQLPDKQGPAELQVHPRWGGICAAARRHPLEPETPVEACAVEIPPCPVPAPAAGPAAGPA